MKVKDVIAECLIRAGKEDFTHNSTLTDEQQKTRNRLLGCFNIAYREIVSKYLPLVHSEKVEFANGVLSAKSLEKKILYPIRVQVGDQRKAFCAGVDKIECDVQGSAILTYAYMPDADFSIDDEFTICALRAPRSSTALWASTIFKTRFSTLRKTSTRSSGRRWVCFATRAKTS